MKVQVLRVKETGKGWNLAYCRCGQFFGTVIASADVAGPGEYELRFTLREKAGWIVPMIRVEPPVPAA